MPTYSDICSNYTGDWSNYPSSIRRQLRILAEYIYYRSASGDGDPFNLDSKNPIKGVIATPELTEDPTYDPRESDADFYTNFGEGELIMKCMENKEWQASSNTGSIGTSSVITEGTKKASYLVSGNFVDFGVPTIVDGVRTFPSVIPVCYIMILIGNIDPFIIPPVSEGPSDSYGSPPVVNVPPFPFDGPRPVICGGWYQDSEPTVREPYWVVPGEGSSQTLPCISPRRLKINQWGFTLNTDTTNAVNRRLA